MIRTITLLIVLLCITELHAQDISLNHGKKWIIQSSIGRAFSISELKNNEITDELIDYEVDHYYMHFVTVNFFINSNIGLNLTLEGNNYEGVDKRKKEFQKNVRNKYENEYFISMDPLRYGKRANIDLFIGVVYRKVVGRFRFMPKFQIGTTSFTLNNEHVYLKKKNSNTILQLTYSNNTDHGVQDYFTIASGITIDYDVSKSFAVTFNAEYQTYKSKFKYLQKIRNTNTEEIFDMTEFNYQKTIKSVFFGIGVSFKI